MFCLLSQRVICSRKLYLFSTVPWLWAATVLAEPDQIRITQWNTYKGSPQSRVACLKQTSDGYLWIGTWYGLARFNGVSFKVFNKSNLPELPSDTINALAEDTNGTLWIGTSKGLVSYREHAFRSFTTNNGLPDPQIWRIAKSKAEGVWVQSGSEVLRFRPGKVSKSWSFSPAGAVHHIEEDQDGWLNVMTDSTWFQISPDAGELRKHSNKVVAPSMWTVGALSKKPNIRWSGGSVGLERIEGTRAELLENEEAGNSWIERLYEDRQGDLWAGDIEGRVLVRSENSWRTIDLGENARGVGILAFEEDQEGNMWVGTSRGLFQIQHLPVRTFTTRDGLPDENVGSICEDGEGTIWMATDKGICRVIDNKIVPLGAIEPHKYRRDRCVCPNGMGGLYFAKENRGLCEFQNGHFNYRATQEELGGPVGVLTQDKRGHLLIGTTNAIVTFEDFKPKRWLSPFPLAQIRSIFEDHEGNFWIGTAEEGLISNRQGQYSRFTKAMGLAGNSIWCIHEDKNGSLWFGTGSGLTRLRNGKFFTFDERQGLFEQVVNCILEDDSGYIWLGGLRGISRIPRSQLDEVAEGKRPAVDAAIIGEADGMESSETNGERQPSGCKAHDGRLWFPTIQGAVVIDPLRLRFREPRIQLEQVVANEDVVFGDQPDAPSPSDLSTPKKRVDSSRDNNGEFRLPAGTAKFLEFYYTANSFVEPRGARFRYRLLGASPGWRETTEPSAHYINLRPGHYTFEVQAADHHRSPWTTTPARFGFYLAPFFWETKTFYVFCGMAVIGLGVAIQAYRLRWQRRFLKLEQQQALADERSRIARDLHDDLGTALTGLALELDVVGRSSEAEPQINERLRSTAKNTRQMAERMREVVWSVNPKCDTVSSVASFLEQQVNQFLKSDSIEARFEIPENMPALPLGAESRHQLALSVREALTNVVRHSKATEVILSLAVVDHSLVVQVRDNGQGFESTRQNSHGLENMRARMTQIGAIFECVSKKGAGTSVTFRIPIRETFGEDSRGKNN